MNKHEPATRSDASFEKLAQHYQQTYTRTVPEALDPAEKDFRKDPLYYAKKVTEDLMRVLELESEEYKLSPAELVFVSELVALNVQQAANCPLTPELVARVKGKAQRYHAEAIAAMQGK